MAPKRLGAAALRSAATKGAELRGGSAPTPPGFIALGLRQAGTPPMRRLRLRGAGVLTSWFARCLFLPAAQRDKSRGAGQSPVRRSRSQLTQSHKKVFAP